MKEFKTKIINRMIERSADLTIVSLKDTANELGYNHISAQDCCDIARELRKIPRSKLMRIVNTHNDSLFCSLCLVDENFDFED